MSGFDDAAKRIRRDAIRAVSDGTEFLLETANRTAPIEESVLIQSGQVTVDSSGKDIIGVASYDTPYAVVQHEDLTLQHDPGRRAKWLELTWREQSSRVLQFMAQRFRQ